MPPSHLHNACVAPIARLPVHHDRQPSSGSSNWSIARKPPTSGVARRIVTSDFLYIEVTVPSNLGASALIAPELREHSAKACS